MRPLKRASRGGIVTLFVLGPKGEWFEVASAGTADPDGMSLLDAKQRAFSVPLVREVFFELMLENMEDQPDGAIPIRTSEPSSSANGADSAIAWMSAGQSR